jgi:hypothetical protein
MGVQYRMVATSQVELQQIQQATHAATPPGAQRDVVVHWQSAFGLIIIEVRNEQVFVNGELVQPAHARDSA